MYILHILQACDMYNVSLILWEIARCTNCLGFASAYTYPFQDELPNDPSVEDVYQVSVANIHYGQLSE